MTNIKTCLLALFLCLFISSSGHTTLKIGTLFFDPPFVFSINEGFDVDLARMLCTAMQERCVLIPMDYNHLFSALSAGTIDLAIGGIAIKSEESVHYIFSLPYMLNKAQFMVLKNSNIHSIDDLKGQKVGALKGNPDGGVLPTYLFNKFTDQFDITQYDDMEDIITALNEKEIVAAFLHQPSVNYWEENGGDLFIAIGPVFTIGQGIGIMALPRNAPLINKINQLLEGMESNNAYLDLYKNYFGD